MPREVSLETHVRLLRRILYWKKIGSDTADLVGPTKYGGSGNSAEEHGGNYGREIFFAGRVL